MTTASNRTMARAGGLFFLGILAGLATAGRAHAQDTTTSSGGVVIIAAPTPVYTPAPPPVYTPAPAPAPPPARRSRAHLGLIISGAVVLGVGWIVNIIPGLFAGTDPFGSDDPGWDGFRLASLLPIAGPWVQLALKPTDFRNDAWGPWLIANGIWQALVCTAVGLVIAGLATIGDEDVPATAEIGGVRMAVLPDLSPDRMGLSVVGSF